MFARARITQKSTRKQPFVSVALSRSNLYSHSCRPLDAYGHRIGGQLRSLGVNNGDCSPRSREPGPAVHSLLVMNDLFFY
jgi:hypothetical protein